MKLPAVVEPELKMAVVTSPALVDVSLKVGVPVTAPVFVDAPLNAGEPVIGPVFGELLNVIVVAVIDPLLPPLPEAKVTDDAADMVPEFDP